MWLFQHCVGCWNWHNFLIFHCLYRLLCICTCLCLDHYWKPDLSLNYFFFLKNNIIEGVLCNWDSCGCYFQAKTDNDQLRIDLGLLKKQLNRKISLDDDRLQQMEMDELWEKVINYYYPTAANVVQIMCEMSTNAY